MAEVFRARLIQPEPTANLPEVFALKRMLPEVLSDPAAQESFLTEADVSPTLVHPNMVRVFLSGLLDGWGFWVMELVDGRHLDALRAARLAVPMPPSEGRGVGRGQAWGAARNLGRRRGTVFAGWRLAPVRDGPHEPARRGAGGRLRTLRGVGEKGDCGSEARGYGARRCGLRG